MKRALQKGFTLIELVVVIVILGILAAIAVPQFTDLAVSARTAVADGACGAAQSSAVLLYASSKAASPAATIIANTTMSGVALTVGTPACTFRVDVPTTGGGSQFNKLCPAIPTALCS